MKRELDDLNNKWRHLSDMSKSVLETLETFSGAKPVRVIEKNKLYKAFGQELHITDIVFDEIINYINSSSCEFFKINVIEKTDYLIKIQLQ